MITAALLSMSACTESTPEHETGTVFQAVSESYSTKTELGGKADGKYPVLWAEGDCITVNGVVSRPLSAEEAGPTLPRLLQRRHWLHHILPCILPMS